MEGGADDVDFARCYHRRNIVNQREGLTAEVVELVDAVPESLGGSETEPGTIVHCRTTFTRGSPSDPVIGLNVMVHVSVAGPELLQHQRMNQYRRSQREQERRTFRSSALSE